MFPKAGSTIHRVFLFQVFMLSYLIFLFLLPPEFGRPILVVAKGKTCFEKSNSNRFMMKLLSLKTIFVEKNKRGHVTSYLFLWSALLMSVTKDIYHKLFGRSFLVWNMNRIIPNAHCNIHYSPEDLCKDFRRLHVEFFHLSRNSLADMSVVKFQCFVKRFYLRYCAAITSFEKVRTADSFKVNLFVRFCYRIFITNNSEKYTVARDIKKLTTLVGLFMNVFHVASSWGVSSTFTVLWEAS